MKQTPRSCWILPYFEIVRDVEPGKDVAIVEVETGWTVHALWHNNHRTYFIRTEKTSAEASDVELKRLFQQRGVIRGELRPVSGASIADLDLRRLVDYFARVRGQEAPPLEDESTWSTLLVNTEIMTEAPSGRVCPTLAGLLLFGPNPNRFLPQAGIDATAFPGREKDYAVLERAQLRGPLTPLFSGEGRQQQLIDNGVVEQAIQFIHRNTAV